MSDRPSVAVLGVGAMGGALASGLIRAGWEPAEVSLCVRRLDRVDILTSQTGCMTTLDPKEAIRGREVVVVAVKPHDVELLVAEIGHALSPEQVVLSLAAGVTTASYEGWLDRNPIIRAMPNTPALVGEGVTGVAPGSRAGEEDLERAMTVLGAVGTVKAMDESLLDAVTAVSGTGPAYIFLLAEALTDAAVREGLPRDIAETFVNQTVQGAGRLLTATDLTPSELRAQVTSPGGTTAAAVHVLEERGFRALVEDAVQAAAVRARELGGGT